MHQSFWGHEDSHVPQKSGINDQRERESRNSYANIHQKNKHDSQKFQNSTDHTKLNKRKRDSNDGFDIGEKKLRKLVKKNARRIKR